MLYTHIGLFIYDVIYDAIYDVIYDAALPFFTTCHDLNHKYKIREKVNTGEVDLFLKPCSKKG